MEGRNAWKNEEREEERESNNAGKVKENILLEEHLIVDGMREDMDSLINDDVIYPSF